MTDKPNPDVLTEITRMRANEMSFRWLPVNKQDDTSFVTRMGRFLVEELAFYPSKVATLAGVFAAKSRVQPGVITMMYLMTVQLILVAPFYIMQAALWQIWRAMKSLYRLCTGNLTYVEKEKLLPKKE